MPRILLKYISVLPEMTRKGFFELPEKFQNQLARCIEKTGRLPPSHKLAVHYGIDMPRTNRHLWMLL